MPTALVTGAAGFIGSHLVESLIDRGYQVHGLDNCSTGKKKNLTEVKDCQKFSFVDGNIQDQEVVADAMESVDAVFHLAAYTSVPGSFKRATTVSEINCMGTATVLEEAVDADVESVVLASSAAVYGSNAPVPVSESFQPTPESPYASSKLYGEQLSQQFAAEFGIDAVALRFFNVYGKRQDPTGEYAAVIPKFIERLVDRKRPVIFGDGKQTRDFVFVEDVVSAIVSAVESGESGVFNIASGERVSVNELLRELNDILGTESDPIYDDPRPGDIRHSSADISAAREAFGYEPTVELSEGLKQTADYFCE